jgi:hypothetical protein
MMSRHKESNHLYRGFIKFTWRKKRVFSWDYATLERSIQEMKKWLVYYAEKNCDRETDLYSVTTAYIVDNNGKIVWGAYE